MATNFITFKPTGVLVHASLEQRKSDSNRSKSTGSANWWSPIFGWSTEPDYIQEKGEVDLAKPVSNKNRFAPGCFTEQKAKQLRLMTQDSATFHDVMYHSAIASRLASDFKRPGVAGAEVDDDL